MAVHASPTSLLVGAALAIVAFANAENTAPFTTVAGDQSPAASSALQRLFVPSLNIRTRFEPASGHPGALADDVRVAFRTDGLCRYFSASAEFRDARAISSEGARDRLDVGQLFADAGSLDQFGWRVRVGRQQLSIGDERLLGADSEWNPLPLSFDAIRATLRRGSVEFDAFTAAPVNVLENRWDRHDGSQRLYGMSARFKAFEQQVEPYVLRTTDRIVGQWRHTAGFVLRGESRSRLQHNVELALQSASEPARRTKAWSGHFELARTFGDESRESRLAAEYNHASVAFNDLYAAAYNRYGMPDPFAARNLRNLEFDGDRALSSRLTISSGYRMYWRVGNSIHITDQVNVAAAYRPAPRWSVRAGLAALIRRQAKEDGAPPSWMPYIALIRTFGPETR